MSLQEDVAAARPAVLALEEATAAVAGHDDDTVDVRRLKADDTEYSHDFWLDAEDEGLGASHRRTP